MSVRLFEVTKQCVCWGGEVKSWREYIAEMGKPVFSRSHSSDTHSHLTSSKAGWEVAAMVDVSREEVLSSSSSLPHRQHDRNGSNNVTNNDSNGAPIRPQIYC